MITSSTESRMACVIALKSSTSKDGIPSGVRAWMWIIEQPSSTARLASAAYSSGVYGIAGHCSRSATAPEIAQVMMQGFAKRLMPSVLKVGSPTFYFDQWRVRRQGAALALLVIAVSASWASAQPPPRVAQLEDLPVVRGPVSLDRAVGRLPWRLTALVQRRRVPVVGGARRTEDLPCLVLR